MNRRLGSLFVGAGAIALAVLGAPAATATAGASSSASTFTLTNTGTTVTKVGTTTWTPTEVAGPSTTAAAAGTTRLTPQAAREATPRIPDVGETVKPEGANTIAAAPGTPKSGSPGRGHNTTGSTSRPGKVAGPTAGLASIAGSDGFDQGVLHPRYVTGVAQPLPGVDVEPPDQGLCAGNGYVMEVNNMVVQIYKGAGMRAESTFGMAMEKFFDAPEVFGGAGTGTVAVQGDPRCYYDPSTNRWFASQIWLTETDGSAMFGWAGEFVAASMTTAPTGGWHVYFIPDQFNAKGVDGCNSLPPATLPSATKPTGAANPCYGDQPLLGVNGNAVFIAVNEYTFAGKKPLGGVGTEYAMSKSDLLSGTPAPLYWGHLGDTVTRPGAGACPFNNPVFGQPTAVLCPWYSIVPAVSDGAYVTSTTGTFYAASNVTFTTSGGHQVAIWKFTNTNAVNGTGSGHITGSVTVATTAKYSEPPTGAVKGTVTATESLATEKAGPHPLGTLWKTLTGVAPIKWPSGEGTIAVNTDRVTTAAYDPATGSVWAGINTATRASGSSETGIFWARVTPTGSGATLKAANVASGVVSGSAVDVYFPSFAFTNSGNGILDYVLSGNDYYPSTGYSLVGATGPTSTIHVARAGAGPADGFSEYTPTYDRPRWGDYSTSVATGTTFYFAAEMVNQSCTVKQFEATFTCAGTRDIEANWGTSVNRLPG